ncbi:MAG: hypothetical protein GX659_02270 [Myxococcales bacterium]|nr:hypothetical protein [Myxococcales bacterium]
MPNITVFDPSEYHVRLVGRMRTAAGLDYEYRAILDTGAPFTEFSDQFLHAAGVLPGIASSVSTKHGLQTQKYRRLKLLRIDICGHVIEDMQVYVSHFEKHWGVDALIGLDFFRQFCVTINYNAGQIITEPYEV